MVSVMEFEQKNEICDSRPGLVQSAISHRAVDLEIMSTPVGSPDDCELSKRVMKLDLQHARLEKGSIDDADDEKSVSLDLKSPKSPQSNASKPSSRNCNMSHQTSINSQVDVIVEDRKALRDALYQGIFHRHRRTIFAVGSFLRMLRTRNSQYNTIRSSSEGDEDTR